MLLSISIVVCGISRFAPEMLGIVQAAANFLWLACAYIDRLYEVVLERERGNISSSLLKSSSPILSSEAMSRSQKSYPRAGEGFLMASMHSHSYSALYLVSISHFSRSSVSPVL